MFLVWSTRNPTFDRDGVKDEGGKCFYVVVRLLHFKLGDAILAPGTVQKIRER